MKHYLLKVIFVVSIVFTSSCASTKYILIDVAQPAKVSFPTNIVNLGIVDNAGLAIPDSVVDETHTTNERLISIGKEEFKNHLLDQMNKEDYFDEVKLYPFHLRTDKKYGDQIPLMKSEVQDIAQQMSVDAVVSIDGFDIATSERKQYYYGTTFTSNVTVQNMLFRIYNSSGEMAVPAMTTSDSIKWVADGKVDYTSLYKNISRTMAEGMVSQLIPYWETQERAYYTDGTKVMKDAHSLVQQGKWKEAADSWGEAFDIQDSNKQRAKIAANIALANENLGDIDNAVEWVKVADSLISQENKNSVEHEYIIWYKEKLQERVKNNPVVLQQFGVSQEE